MAVTSGRQPAPRSGHAPRRDRRCAQAALRRVPRRRLVRRQAPWINDIVPGSGQDFVYLVGVIEILVVLNLLTASGFYDIALRDFGLLLAALTLARLASVYDPPIHRGRS